MPPLAVTHLTGGEVVLRSRLWATNSVLVGGRDGCLVCDPSVFPDEVAQIRAATRGHPPVYVLVTHSDFDHVCGLPAFPDATVVAGAGTAAAIADGTARRKLEESGQEWGISWEGELRVDIAVSGERVACGDLEVAAIDTRGHIDDGSAFVVVERRLLLPGDYLSAACPPIVLGSFGGAIASVERLLVVIDEHDIATIVPGHGPVLEPDRARRIGREDIRYLRALQDAASEAVRAGASANGAFLAVRAVAAPRRARPDFAAFDWLGANARRALAEAGHEAYVVNLPLDMPERRRSSRARRSSSGRLGL
jgi:glyoxylase-like metal-dependent hydrolase (beta-lactamase superfamily II)